MEPIETRLKKLGNQRQTARKQLRATSKALPPLIKEAIGEDIPKTKIAQLAGISRPALDQILKS